MIFYSPDDGGGAGASGAQSPAPAASGTPASAAPADRAGLSQTSGAGQASGVVMDGTPSIIADEGKGTGITYVQPDGSFAPDWTSKLPEDLAPARDSLGRFKSVTDLARAYDSANKLIGRKGVILPNEKSTPEEVAAFHKTMGVPETPEGYMEAVRPTELPEGVTWSDEIAKSYFELAHHHHVPATAMKDLIGLHLKQRQFEQEAAQHMVIENKQKGLKQLRQIWGVDFDRNLGIAQRAAALTGVDANSYGWRDPEVVKGFVRLASMMGDDKLVTPGASLPAGGADLKSRAIDIIRNPANPDHQKYRDGDQDVQQRVRRYLEQAGG
jgi:hypothetical protein